MWWIVVKYLFLDDLLPWLVCKTYSTLKNEQSVNIDFLYIGLSRHSLVLGKQKGEKDDLGKKLQKETEYLVFFSFINFEVV